MSQIILPTEEFCLSELQRRSENCNKIEGKKIVRNIDLCSEYISKYFYPLTNGDHAFYAEGKFTIYSNEVLRTVYLNRFPDDVSKWYCKNSLNLYNRVCQLNKPIIYDKNINIVGKFLHKYKPYSEFTKKIQDNVEFMLQFYKDIWASSDNANYEFILDWIANMCQGNRNHSLIYLK